MAWMSSFPDLEIVCCSMSSSNYCFLSCIQISQEAGQVVWYSHYLKNFPQFVMIHTVKGFGIVNRAEVDVFLELSCIFDDPMDVGDLISSSSAFSKSILNIWKFLVHRLLKPHLENFENYFAIMWDCCRNQYYEKPSTTLGELEISGLLCRKAQRSSHSKLWAPNKGVIQFLHMNRHN